jgi:hypothetical protein
MALTLEQKATAAALKCMKHRGYVVCAFPCTDVCSEPNIGEVTSDFGNGFLPDHTITFTEETTKADWDAQWTFLFGGRKEKAQHDQRARYFRGVVTEDR